jgi:hypothetical protein
VHGRLPVLGNRRVEAERLGEDGLQGDCVSGGRTSSGGRVVRGNEHAVSERITEVVDRKAWNELAARTA